ILDHILEVLLGEMRQHETVVKLRAPTDQRALIGKFPETRNYRAQKQVLREAHARVRRHLEGAQLQQAEPSRAALGRVEFIDAKLGAVRVAGGIDQQVPKKAIHEPGRNRSGGGAGPRAPRGKLPVQLLEGDLQLIQRIVPGLIHPRVLAGGADELAGKQKRERRMILPETKQAAKQVRAAEYGAVRGRFAADDNMIAPA